MGGLINVMGGYKSTHFPFWFAGITFRKSFTSVHSSSERPPQIISSSALMRFLKCSSNKIYASCFSQGSFMSRDRRKRTAPRKIEQPQQRVNTGIVRCRSGSKLTFWVKLLLKKDVSRGHDAFFGISIEIRTKTKTSASLNQRKPLQWVHCKVQLAW